MFSFNREFNLIQETPIIHFQHDQDGVCLRPSELKPKLDRFIHEWLKKKKIPVPKSWYVNLQKANEYDALNYKISIKANGIPIRSNTIETELSKINHQDTRGKPNRQIPATYFGNMFSGETKEEKIENVKKSFKETVFYKEPITLSVICFVKETIDISIVEFEKAPLGKNKMTMLEFIEFIIDPFFMLHTFGTRQSKGFGSFRIETGLSGFKMKISDFYRQYYYLQYLSSIPRSATTMLDDIWAIYGLMKSGFNFTKVRDRQRNCIVPSGTPEDYYKGFIFQYMHNYYHNGKGNFGNDKAFIKCKVLKDMDNKADPNIQNPRFVRAMLGLTDQYKYDFRGKKREIHLSHNETDGSKIERFSSPILFKPHNNRIYIFPQSIPQEMFDEPFSFSEKIKDKQSKDEKSKDPEKLRTPSPEEFNLLDFLDAFMEYYNEEDNRIIRIKRENGVRLLRECKYKKLQKTIEKKLKIKKIGGDK